MENGKCRAGTNYSKAGEEVEISDNDPDSGSGTVESGPF